MSDKNQVTLEDVNLSSAGQYRCEISAEAPLFNTVAQSKKMNVIGNDLALEWIKCDANFAPLILSSSEVRSKDIR